MTQPSFKEAITICKSIMRNGFDAHIVNTQLQHELIVATEENEIDLATDAPIEELLKIFPGFDASSDVCDFGENRGILGILSEDGVLYRFYRMQISDSCHPETVLTRLTPAMLRKMEKLGPLPPSLVHGMGTLAPCDVDEANYGFTNLVEGTIKFEGLPDETLRKDYSLAIRALRFAANYNYPIEPNTWMAIIRASQRILVYVPIQKIVEEWKKVEAENMWIFVKLMYECHILQGILPEIAGLDRVKQTKNDSNEEQSVFEHTLNCVRYYPEGEFSNDWYGTFAMLFHCVGKLYTAEFYQGRWTFYEYHRVGAEVTRKILRRLGMMPEDISLICNLVLNHVRFFFMMTDKGIRRFKAQDDTQRLIEISRADIKAREDNYTAFNHNTKYLKRADMPEKMLEPLLNGNEIMEVTGLKPGPYVGDLRQALLKAQIADEVHNEEEAILFVQKYFKQHS